MSQSQIPVMTLEMMQVYLDERFNELENRLDAIAVSLSEREAEYGIVMQGIRHLAQHIGTQDALNNLVVSLEQKRKTVRAARRKK